MRPPPEAPFEIPPIITYAVPAFVILILAEMIYVRLTRKGRYETADSATSLTMGFGNRIAGILFGGFAVAAYFWVYQFRLFDLGWTWPVMVACFFAEDLAYYWFHRIAHERRWFWASHVIHHTSQHYNLTTALRQTWTGVLSLSFIFWLPLVYIGFPPLMVLMFSAISLVYQFWIHTETIGRMGPLEWVMNTPSHHRVHHAINAKYLDANYAGVLIIWDRLFGTFVPEDDKEKPRYGIITQLGTFNPFRVAFHEWAGIWRDVTHAKSPREVWFYLFGPPGWSPDGSRKTSRSIKQAWAALHKMYVPSHFAVEDADALIARLARRWAGVLVTTGEDGAPVGTHLPILWDAERKIATGHIARANPHWKQGATRGLIVLAGPEAYVTPAWYPSKAEHGKNVPTWNYEAVHLTGRVEWFDEPARLEAVVRDLSALHEQGRAEPWSISDAPRPYIDALLRGIVGVALHAERVEAKRKLSQNKSEADFHGVARGLAASEDAMEQEVAQLMRATRALADDPEGN